MTSPFSALLGFCSLDKNVLFKKQPFFECPANVLRGQFDSYRGEETEPNDLRSALSANRQLVSFVCCVKSCGVSCVGVKGKRSERS